MRRGIHGRHRFGFHLEPIKTPEDASDQFARSLLQPGAHQYVNWSVRLTGDLLVKIFQTAPPISAQIPVFLAYPKAGTR